MPVTFHTDASYRYQRSNIQIIQGIFYGLMLVMILYNIFLYLSVKRKSYLYYVCFVSSFLILQLGLTGFGFQYLWPNTPWINDYSIATGGAFSLLFLILFARAFLKLGKVPLFSLPVLGMLFLASVLVLSSLILPYKWVILPLAISVIISAIMLIAMAVHRYVNGYHEARFYLLAWVVMVTGSIIYLLKQMGILPVNALTEYSMQLGSAFEMILLSLALADRINSMKIRLQSANIELERKVDERTEKLETTLLQLEKANQQLELMAMTDRLTGLHNRHFFDEYLQHSLEEVKQFKGSTLSLILVDIDFFKRINDQWGHVVGDDALIWVSQCLNEVIKRKTDQVCRYGGEEFAIILPEASLETAIMIAQSLRDKVETSNFIQNEQRIPITISLGVSSTEHIETLSTENLVLSADTSLYSAKSYGRNCVRWVTAQDELSVEDEVPLYSQQQVDLINQQKSKPC